MSSRFATPARCEKRSRGHRRYFDFDSGGEVKRVCMAGDKSMPLRLLVHGFLHLLGYDHGNEKEARRMEALERKLCSSCGNEKKKFYEKYTTAGTKFQICLSRHSGLPGGRSRVSVFRLRWRRSLYLLMMSPTTKLETVVLFSHYGSSRHGAFEQHS